MLDSKQGTVRAYAEENVELDQQIATMEASVRAAAEKCAEEHEELMSDTMKRMYRLEISNAALRGENARLNQEISTLQGIPQRRLLQERVFGISAEEDYVTMLNKQSEELERKETIIMELGIEQVRRDHVFAYEMDRL